MVRELRFYSILILGAAWLTLALLSAAPASAGQGECGIASWYGFEAGAHTANGERYDPLGMTAAHRTLPFGTIVRVTLDGRSVTVRINDRGPAARTGREIDLSLGAATVLGMVERGVAPVCIEVVP